MNRAPRISCIATLLLITLWPVSALNAQEAPPQQPAPPPTLVPSRNGELSHWRVIWKADPAHQATVSWSTPRPALINRVYYDTVSHNGNIAEYPHFLDCTTNGKFSGSAQSPDQPQFYHHAQFKDLQPNTRYYIVLNSIFSSDSYVTREFYFITAPDDDQPVKLLIGADSRNNPQMRGMINLRIRSLFEAEPRIIAFAQDGNFADGDGDLAEWDAWLDDNSLTVARDGRLLPIIPARGNHDTGYLFNQVFDFPPGDPDYYSLRLSRQVSFITLNTETSMAGDQKRWLERQLQNAQSSRWIMVQYARAAFPALQPPSGALQLWVPLFDRYNVDLVYEAGGTIIKRTLPIRYGKYHPEGVVYFGEGSLGARSRTPRNPEWYLRTPGITGSGDNVLLLDFQAERVHARTIMMDGTIFDDYSIIHKPYIDMPAPPGDAAPQTSASDAASTPAPSPEAQTADTDQP